MQNLRDIFIFFYATALNEPCKTYNSRLFSQIFYYKVLRYVIFICQLKKSYIIK